MSAAAAVPVCAGSDAAVTGGVTAAAGAAAGAAALAAAGAAGAGGVSRLSRVPLISRAALDSAPRRSCVARSRCSSNTSRSPEFASATAPNAPMSRPVSPYSAVRYRLTLRASRAGCSVVNGLASVRVRLPTFTSPTLRSSVELILRRRPASVHQFRSSASCWCTRWASVRPVRSAARTPQAMSVSSTSAVDSSGLSAEVAAPSSACASSTISSVFAADAASSSRCVSSSAWLAMISRCEPIASRTVSVHAASGTRFGSSYSPCRAWLRLAAHPGSCAPQ